MVTAAHIDAAAGSSFLPLLLSFFTSPITEIQLQALEKEAWGSDEKEQQTLSGPASLKHAAGRRLQTTPGGVEQSRVRPMLPAGNQDCSRMSG